MGEKQSGKVIERGYVPDHLAIIPYFKKERLTLHP
jgi:hypothetical protein